MSLAALAIATPLFGLSLTIDPSLAIGPAVATGPAITASVPLAPEAEGDEGGGGPSRAEQLAQRGRIAPIHKWMGISTWVSMTATVVLGWIQYNNLYGFFSGLGETPCDSGNAVGGVRACIKQPPASFGQLHSHHGPIQRDLWPQLSNARPHELR